jgi:hypothetical protein
MKTKNKAKTTLSLQQPQQHAPTALLNTVFDFLITTKILSEFLPRAKDLRRLSICARSFVPFRLQVREMKIQKDILTEPLLRHMESGGFAYVTTIEFKNSSCLASRSMCESLKNHFRSASGALAGLTSLSYDASYSDLGMLTFVDDDVWVRLEKLSLDLAYVAPRDIINSLLQRSNQLHTLQLYNLVFSAEIELERAFNAGCFEHLHTLQIHTAAVFARTHVGLSLLLRAILQGHAPNLEKLRFCGALGDESISVLVQFFPFLSLFDLQLNNFSPLGETSLLEAAEQHPDLTVLLSEEEEEYNYGEEDSDVEEDEVEKEEEEEGGEDDSDEEEEEESSGDDDYELGEN